MAWSDGSGRWREIDIGSLDSAEFLLATDEYIVVLAGSGRSVELVKIPFAPG